MPQARVGEVQDYAPPLVGRDLEVAWQPLGRDHRVLEILREGPLVGLDADEVLRVVHGLRGRRGVEAVLCDLYALGWVEPDERHRRAPEVLYHPEGHVAPLHRLSDRLGEARTGQAHVPGLPRLRLSDGPEAPAALGYATNLFHDARILQLSSGRCPR
jgi:hypothetical protein